MPNRRTRRNRKQKGGDNLTVNSMPVGEAFPGRNLNPYGYPAYGGGYQILDPMPFEQAFHGPPLAPTGSSVKDIVPPATLRQGLLFKPMYGGQMPLKYTNPHYTGPSGPAETLVQGVVPPVIIRPALPAIGGRRIQRKRGGFYPSIMGGVVANAPLLAPLAARQGLTLLGNTRVSRKSRRTRTPRKTVRRRSSGRRA
jgi:hypothetical protein